MKVAIRLLALALSTAGVSAQALDAPWIFRTRQILTCPSVGAAYETMLNDLDALKTSIKKDANCLNVQLKVDSLEKLVVQDREKFLVLVEKSKTTPLTNEEGAEMATYMEAITKKVASLSDLFSGSNYCFSDDAAAQNKVASMAGFINEASQLIGAVAGPWGAPIAIGGRIIAGFITGMEAVAKSRAGYDFSQPLQWRNYVNNLCAYYNFTPQIANLLVPQQQAAALTGLADKLDKQIKGITDRCPDCQQILQTFEANPEKDPTEVIRMTRTIVSQVNGNFTNPVGTYTLQAAALRRWAISEKARVLKEANDFSKEASGRYLLFKAKQDLDAFLIQKSAPQFLNFQIRESATQWSELQRFLTDKGGQLYRSLDRLSPGVLPDMDSFFGPSTKQVFEVLIKKEIPWDRMKPSAELEDLRYAWNSFGYETSERINSYKTTLGAFENFCQFFRVSGNYNSGIRSSCMQGQYVNLKSVDRHFDIDTTPLERPYSLTVVDAIDKTIDEISVKIL